MGAALKTLAAVFALAGGLCLGAGAISEYRAGNTHNGVTYGAAGVLWTASGALGLKLRRF
jgi:hypothetical protein